MPEFLLELYVSQSDASTVESSARSARRAAKELTDEGRPVEYVRSIFVPVEETCFLLYEARSAEDVREAARRAHIPFDHVVHALDAHGAREERP